MKKVFLFMTCCLCFCAAVSAQNKAPKWMEKSYKAVVSITTYGKDNNQLATGVGFFVNETGDILSSYSLFKGAAKATITDADGTTTDVESIVGSDALYDAIKIRITPTKKITFLPIINDPIPNGTPSYLLAFSTNKKDIKFAAGAITEVSKLKDNYKYYKLNIPLADGQANSPILTVNGEAFGLAQTDASGNKNISYALSASYVNQLAYTSANFISSNSNDIGIKKCWPKDGNQATAVLYIIGSMQDPKAYLATINDFIKTFPDSTDGYLTRANHYASQRKALSSDVNEQLNLLNLALNDFQTAAKLSTKKSEIWYNQAKLIYNVAITDSTINNAAWTKQSAFEAIQKAIQEEDLPVYHQFEGDMYYNEGKFKEAYNDYTIVNNSDIATATSYYWAAKALQNISGFNFGDVLDLLNKAVDKAGTVTPDAAPFILERIEWRLRLQQYTEAVADYNLYYEAVAKKVSPNFFYLREQAKFHGGDLEGALQDIQEAIKQSPDTEDYLAEEASIYVRQQKYTEAFASLDKALKINPKFAACYRLKGVIYLRQKKNADACTALHKAQELGDPVAEKLISQNCK